MALAVHVNIHSCAGCQLFMTLLRIVIRAYLPEATQLTYYAHLKCNSGRVYYLRCYSNAVNVK